ncbi:hypothetical protein G6F31_020891 [Rhizopus arrhizus]|nr:hypothetical protein G6F31_020891 [Rhizopus arrhizus]
MNAALGADLPVPESTLAALRAARGKPDAQIDQLLALYAAPLDPEKIGARAEIQRIRHALPLARIQADLVITTPRDQLTGDAHGPKGRCRHAQRGGRAQRAFPGVAG